ncbi:MAG: exodeoxyribonuclease III [Epsilonproteobacteria bacterium]|nr:MAG: exodeoxyribonuclease III [Campylobacterota bacterium]RLA65818.1 MAG: exodeoxyribonuclease III [Campylobacterota bacterium]
MEIKIVSWNVNGIRACQRKGFEDWLNTERPDIVCLQETKASPEQLDESLVENNNYLTYYSSAEKKGYSGTAIFSLKALDEPKVTIGLGIPKFDCEGRTVIAEYNDFFLINGYFPNGQRDHGRVPYKLEYSRAVAKRALELEKKKPVIITGDVNTAHSEIDLKNPRANKNSTGFLQIERAWIDEFINQGFTDIFRELHPGEEGQYTWWTYRANARERNIGWRLDYFFITQGMLKSVSDCYHLPKVMGSDHCPTVLKIKIT